VSDTGSCAAWRSFRLYAGKPPLAYGARLHRRAFDSSAALMRIDDQRMSAIDEGKNP
jgi:hypothetical protein